MGYPGFSANPYGKKHSPHLGWLVGWVGGLGGLAGWLAGWVGWLVGLAGWLGWWLVGWLAGWLVGWLAGWLVGWLAGWLVRKLVSIYSLHMTGACGW